ncbi:uncharacterized protein E0L32_008091 [Thyridium curvatum]|uniref:DEUBAD domain-containing protein n=1 Tax=Thyridium curvatum TaxID=1093900 RepID=A0A507AKA7_9PEZI|nr:uncharacterized protein E0L32_008091 [Thyridium curvatum]TPX10885.1 hypothetical protein E0L32_008091 [Thyridium curvatum]
MPTRSAKKPQADKKWEAEFILTDSKSPLATADLRAILCHPQAWSVLSKEEQTEILALFPDQQHVLDAGTAQARPNIESLRNDNNFRHDCARFAQDLKDGTHDRDWLTEAWEAHERRKMGFFDEFEAGQFQEEWKVELPDEYKPAAMVKVKVKEESQGSGQGVTSVSVSENSTKLSQDKSPQQSEGKSPQRSEEMSPQTSEEKNNQEGEEKSPEEESEGASQGDVSMPDAYAVS